MQQMREKGGSDKKRETDKQIRQTDKPNYKHPNVTEEREKGI